MDKIERKVGTKGGGKKGGGPAVCVRSFQGLKGRRQAGRIKGPPPSSKPMELEELDGTRACTERR